MDSLDWTQLKRNQIVWNWGREELMQILRVNKSKNNLSVSVRILSGDDAGHRDIINDGWLCNPTKNQMALQTALDVIQDVQAVDKFFAPRPIKLTPSQLEALRILSGHGTRSENRRYPTLISNKNSMSSFNSLITSGASRALANRGLAEVSTGNAWITNEGHNYLQSLDAEKPVAADKSERTLAALTSVYDDIKKLSPRKPATPAAVEQVATASANNHTLSALLDDCRIAQLQMVKTTLAFDKNYQRIEYEAHERIYAQKCMALVDFMLNKEEEDAAATTSFDAIDNASELRR